MITSFGLRKGRTCTVASECDSLVVAAKVMNIFVNPLECQLLIFQAHIAGVFGQSQRQETENAYAVVNCDLSLNTNKEKTLYFCERENAKLRPLTKITSFSIKKSGA